MLICARSDHRIEIEDLLDRNLGKERLEKTAYRLRARADPIPGLSMVILSALKIVASVQYWPVQLIDDAQNAMALTLLGPIIVDTSLRNGGLGKRLMRASLAAADAAGHAAIVLIGDPEYYDEFGFSAAKTADWQLPGPFERHRLLLRADAQMCLPVKAQLAPLHNIAA